MTEVNTTEADSASCHTWDCTDVQLAPAVPDVSTAICLVGKCVCVCVSMHACMHVYLFHHFVILNCFFKHRLMMQGKCNWR